MALEPHQEDLYTARITVWRETEVIDGASGKVGSSTWAVVSALTGTPCYFQTGQSVKGIDGFFLDESDNMFTFDAVHMEIGLDIRRGDILKQTTGDDAGKFWIAKGDPQERSALANRQIVIAKKLPTPPEGVS